MPIPCKTTCERDVIKDSEVFVGDNLIIEFIDFKSSLLKAYFEATKKLYLLLYHHVLV